MPLKSLRAIRSGRLFHCMGSMLPWPSELLISSSWKLLFSRSLHFRSSEFWNEIKWVCSGFWMTYGSAFDNSWPHSRPPSISIQIWPHCPRTELSFRNFQSQLCSYLSRNPHQSVGTTHSGQDSCPNPMHSPGEYESPIWKFSCLSRCHHLSLPATLNPFWSKLFGEKPAKNARIKSSYKETNTFFPRSLLFSWFKWMLEADHDTFNWLGGK